MDYSENGVPMFNGQNGFKYEMWSRRTEVFLQAQGNYIWLSVVTGYDSSKRAKTATKKELKKNNKIAMDFIWEGLPKPVREKVGKCSSAKELWDKLHDIYSSPITDSENAKEDADTEQEERCSSCQTDSEEEEYDEAEVDYKEKLISAIKYLRKEREENKSSKKELMKQKQSVQGFEKDQQVIKNLRAQLEEARRIEETLEYQKKCLEANIAAQKKDAEKRENILMDHLKERTNDLNQLEEEFGQEERRMEEEIIALKIQLEEAKRTEEVMKSQIMKKEEEVENLEEEVVTLRVKIDKLNKKVEETKTSTSVVENEEKHSTLLEKKNEENRKSYAEVLKGRNHGQPESKKTIEDTSSRIPSMFKPQKSFNHDHDQSKKKFRRTTPQRRSFTPRYENLFYGHCFYCTNFGHKVADCRDYKRNVQADRAYVVARNIECYKCHNYGHIASDCRSVIDTSMKDNTDIRYKKVWIRKQED
jgi:myosin heavy subunit